MSKTTLPVFQQTLEKSNHWIDEIAEQLDWTDRHRAYRALRAVLHALRDQLTIDEAVDASAQLPMLIRGMFFEGWSPGKQRTRTRDVDKFTDRINEHFSDMDVADLWDSGDISRAVFDVMSNHVSEGEIPDIVDSLPKQLRELWY